MTRPPGQHRALRLLMRLLDALVACVALWLLLAYVVAPALWRVHEHRHPALEDVPHRAVTRQGIPGDPINVSLVGTEDEVQRTLLQAGWRPADAKTLRSAVRIAADVIARRPYELAPVSDLFVWGRRQDLAFEQPVGGDPRRRHHVRFWRSTELDADGRPLWAGAATFDTRAGVSHYTGQITHHIAPDIDAERDKLVDDLERTKAVDVSWVDGFQKQKTGRNAGGDPYTTDGRLAVIHCRRTPPDRVTPPGEPHSTERAPALTGAGEALQQR